MPISSPYLPREPILEIERLLEGAEPIELYTFVIAQKQFLYTSHDTDITITDNNVSSLHRRGLPESLTVTPGATYDRNLYKPPVGTYKSENIKRGSIELQSSVKYNKNITITAAFDHLIPKIAIYGAAPTSVGVYVHRLYPRAPGAAIPTQLATDVTTNTRFYSYVLFTGEIDSFEISKNTSVTMTSISPFARVMENEIPSVRWQNTCNHTLYDQQCGIDRTAWRWLGTIMQDTDNTDNPRQQVFREHSHPMGQDSFSALDRDFFRGGYIEIFDEDESPRRGPSDPDRNILDDIRDGLETGTVVDRKTIVASLNPNIVGRNIFLSYPLALMDTGRTRYRCAIYAGCSHNTVDCGSNKFNNLVNFGGFPYTPWS